MALTPNQIAELLKLRALGWSQSEIAEVLNTSQQVIGYHLKKLKEQSKKRGTDEVFNAALIGGLAVRKNWVVDYWSCLKKALRRSENDF